MVPFTNPSVPLVRARHGHAHYAVRGQRKSASERRPRRWLKRSGPRSSFTRTIEHRPLRPSGLLRPFFDVALQLLKGAERFLGKTDNAVVLRGPSHTACNPNFAIERVLVSADSATHPWPPSGEEAQVTA